jgi:hypothetical protein
LARVELDDLGPGPQVGAFLCDHHIGIGDITPFDYDSALP